MKVKRLTTGQINELARCMCIECGVIPTDDVKAELACAHRQLKSILKHYGNAKRKLAEEMEDNSSE